MAKGGLVFTKDNEYYTPKSITRVTIKNWRENGTEGNIKS